LSRWVANWLSKQKYKSINPKLMLDINSPSKIFNDKPFSNQNPKIEKNKNAKR
jgi:hypothetical protein